MTHNLLRLFVAVVIVFLLLPILSVILSSFASTALLVFPPQGWTLRWYESIPPEFFRSIQVSLIVAVGTTVMATLLGTPIALAIVRGRFPGKHMIGAFCIAPLAVPALVLGVMLYQYSLLAWEVFGVSLTRSITGLILGHTVFTIPFVIRAAIAGQAHFDHSIEEASLNLGATPWQTFSRVTLPIITPGIVAGAIFAFIMSFDDVPVSLFLGGGEATPLPVKIYNAVEFSLSADVMAVGTIVIFGSLACVLLLNRIISLERLFGAR